MVNQVLFGELYEVLEEEGEWLFIRLWHDGTTGWIARACHHAVDAPAVEAYLAGPLVPSPSLLAVLLREGGWETRLVVAGSLLPLLDAATGRLQVGEERHLLAGGYRAGEHLAGRERVVAAAFMYHNTPHASGGRSPRGIDDTGLAQLAYRQAGVALPRGLEGQLATGETLAFIEETLPGDLLFFGDDERVSHVGIAWTTGRVIHASGRVRVDKVDHHGIFNEEIRRYTHALKVIKRLLP
jgi:hypothetical protein